MKTTDLATLLMALALHTRERGDLFENQAIELSKAGEQNGAMIAMTAIMLTQVAGILEHGAFVVRKLAQSEPDV